MATDLIQRAAAIIRFTGYLSPNSDDLSAWLRERCIYGITDRGRHGCIVYVGQPVALKMQKHAQDLREALAAAVVEVDRIEREAAK